MVQADASLKRILKPGRNVTDWGGMQKAGVKNVARPQTEADLEETVKFAARSDTKVSLRGSGHSAGGHSFCQDGLMIDLRDLNQVLELDQQNKTVRVQAGATWAVLTKILEPAGLAVTTKQEFDTFTIGGSIACNVHGKSIDYGPIIENIISLRLLLADGEIVTVSRQENGELFRAVVGGYGLLGIVVDVTLQLVDDRAIEKTEVVFMNLEPLLAAYIDRVRSDPENTPLCYGFIDPEGKQGYYVTYKYVGDDRQYSLDQLKRDETNPTLFNVFIWLQRNFKFTRRRAFHLMWSGSNKPEVTLRSRRLLIWDVAPSAFQKLLFQKYFVPVDNFLPFMQKAGQILKKYEDDLPVLTNHFRFVPGNNEALLSFSPEDTICMIPCYLAKKNNRRWVAKLEQATDELLNACLEQGGSYYLTFDIIASKKQLQQAYPCWDEFLALKNRCDPEGLFNSRFYEKYSESMVPSQL